MTEEVINRVLQQMNLFGPNDALHGFVVMLNNKIWKSRDGAFIFESRRRANQTFYNQERWYFTRTVSTALYGLNSYGMPEHYDHSTRLWNEFKSSVNFKIVEI